MITEDNLQCKVAPVILHMAILVLNGEGRPAIYTCLIHTCALLVMLCNEV